MALRRNILIFHQGALGDFVLTWPIAIALARIHPQSRLFYVTHSQKGKLAEKVLGIESADSESGWHSLFGDRIDLPEMPAKLIAGAHSVLGFLSQRNDQWIQNVKHVAPEANVLTIDPNPPENWTAHATAYQLEQLRPWSAAQAAAVQIHRSIESRGLPLARSSQPQLRDIVIHPGSGSARKNWPIERYIDLAHRLKSAGHPIRFTLGEVEQEKWDADAIKRLSAAGDVQQQQGSLLDLKDQIANARAFVGNDSGPGHLAAILGVPTLALFGPTDPICWKPLGPHVRALRHEPLDALSVDAVFNELTACLQSSE
jgi:ADP-heptose:LPS heptosyltransferase